MHNRRNKSEVGQCVSSTVSDPFVQSELLEGSHLDKCKLLYSLKEWWMLNTRCQEKETHYSRFGMFGLCKWSLLEFVYTNIILEPRVYF